MVAGIEKPFDDQVQGLSSSAVEDYAFGCGEIQQSGYARAQCGYPFVGLHAFLPCGPADIGAVLLEEGLYDIGCAGSLGKRCGRIVQIDALHEEIIAHHLKRIPLY